MGSCNAYGNPTIILDEQNGTRFVPFEKSCDCKGRDSKNFESDSSMRGEQNETP